MHTHATFAEAFESARLALDTREGRWYPAPSTLLSDGIHLMRRGLPSLLLLVAALAAAPAHADEAKVVRLVVVDLQAKGVDEALAKTLGETLATALAKDSRFSVAAGDDIRTLLRHTEEQQLVGCADEKCFAGLAAIMGADALVHGSVGKVGESYVLNLSRIDVEKGVVAERVSEVVKKADDFLGKVDQVASTLIGKVGSIGKRDDVPVSWVRTREQAVFAAVQYDKARKSKLARPKTRYVASFGSEHFGFGEHDKLEKFLPIKADLAFPGRFPSCMGRSETYEDAFTIKDDKGVGIKVGDETAYQLLQLIRRRKLVLDVEFEVVGAKLFEAKEYDWRLCPGDQKPFRPTDISPNAYIRVKSAVLRDMFNDRRYAVTRQVFDPESEKLSYQSLPEPPADPEAPPVE